MPGRAERAFITTRPVAYMATAAQSHKQDQIHAWLWHTALTGGGCCFLPGSSLASSCSAPCCRSDTHRSVSGSCDSSSTVDLHTSSNMARRGDKQPQCCSRKTAEGVKQAVLARFLMLPQAAARPQPVPALTTTGVVTAWHDSAYRGCCHLALHSQWSVQRATGHAGHQQWIAWFKSKASSSPPQQGCHSAVMVLLKPDVAV